MSLVTRVGGRGGFLASVRDIGTEHPPGMKVSADETARGGAGGSFFVGGATNPGSSEPSPARQGTAQARSAMMCFIVSLWYNGVFRRSRALALFWETNPALPQFPVLDSESYFQVLGRLYRSKGGRGWDAPHWDPAGATGPPRMFPPEKVLLLLSVLILSYTLEVSQEKRLSSMRFFVAHPPLYVLECTIEGWNRPKQEALVGFPIHANMIPVDSHRPYSGRISPRRTAPGRHKDR